MNLLAGFHHPTGLRSTHPPRLPLLPACGLGGYPSECRDFGSWWVLLQASNDPGME